jgi:hypothetical protein
MLNIVLLYLVKIIHLLMMCFILFGPYVSNHPLWLMSIIWFNMGVVSMWYIYGYCFITDIENFLRPPEEIDPSQTKSFITTTVETYLPFLNKTLIEKIISSIPCMVTCICLVKLYMTYPKVQNTVETVIENVIVSDIPESLRV